MDPILIAAYATMRTAHACTVDTILEDPNLRTEFLTLVRASVPDRPEREILHGLTNLRKRSKLPKSPRQRKAA